MVLGFYWVRENAVIKTNKQTNKQKTKPISCAKILNIHLGREHRIEDTK